MRIILPSNIRRVTVSAETLHEIKAPGPARTKRGMLVAQVEASFINQTIASMHALKEIGRRSLPAATAQGAQAALDVFYRAIDAKISALHQSMRTADNAWNDLAELRREASQLPSGEFSPAEGGILGLGRARARLNELTDRHATATDLLRRMVEVSGLYMNASLQVTQFRAEIASLMNGASLFLSEQVGVASALTPSQVGGTLEATSTPALDRDHLSVVPPVIGGAFQYQPPLTAKAAVG